MNWADELDRRVRDLGNPVLVGLDPHMDLLPEEYAAAVDTALPRDERAAAVAGFCCELIDVCAGRVAAVKPQIAFFEVFGADGLAAWETVVKHAHAAGLLVLGDVKRGDISSTAGAYATAFLEGLPGGDPTSLCDAITVNPYLGDDAVLPFVEACERTGKGIYVLVRTSNPGSARVQHHGEPALSVQVADAVAQWGSGLVGESGFSSIGAVVGATHKQELRSFRERMPRTPLLLPGFGAQGAGAEDIVDGFTGPGPSGALVNSSRGIAFAYRSERYSGLSWKDAASAALGDMIDEISAALSARAPRART